MTVLVHVYKEVDRVEQQSSPATLVRCDGLFCLEIFTGYKYNYMKRPVGQRGNYFGNAIKAFIYRLFFPYAPERKEMIIIIALQDRSCSVSTLSRSRFKLDALGSCLIQKTTTRSVLLTLFLYGE